MTDIRVGSKFRPVLAAIFIQRLFQPLSQLVKPFCRYGQPKLQHVFKNALDTLRKDLILARTALDSPRIGFGYDNSLESLCCHGFVEDGFNSLVHAFRIVWERAAFSTRKHSSK